MKISEDIPQIFLRLSISLGFILAVMDRMGWLGEVGVNGNAWGNWSNFVDYTNSLMPFLNRRIANVMAILATVAEVVFGVLLIISYKVRSVAWGSSMLTLIFAICMFFSSDFRAPFTYGVFVNSAAALLLATIPVYRWSIDRL